MSIIGENNTIDVEGRLRIVIDALATKNIILLPGGALEHYLPSYTGPRFELKDVSKVEAVDKEIQILSNGAEDLKLEVRYGALFNCISMLPAKDPVDMNSILLRYAADFIHEMQGLVLSHADWKDEHINKHFLASSNGLGKLFTVAKLERNGIREFNATISIAGPGNRVIQISDKTNAGMQKFSIKAK